MKVYIVLDVPSYESSSLIAVYANADAAQKRVACLERRLELYQQKQRKLQSEGNDDAWTKPPPHFYHDLCWREETVIPNKTDHRKECQ
jgi:hypothetical protein